MITKNSSRTLMLTGAVAAAGLMLAACTHGYVGYQQTYYTPAYSSPAPAPAYAPPSAYPAAAPATVYQPLNEAQLDQLTSPIALYADPLLAQLLPAATYPAEIQAASAWLAANPQPTEAAIDAQPWDASVKAIVHYPTVLQMMNERIDWTQALGAAFANQQADVMASIQQLRLEAQAAGTLQTTAQQDVVVADNCVRILPANPDVIYVPVYDPNAVYVAGGWGWSRPVITFGIGFNVGGWLDNDCDWHDHRVMVHGDWRRDVRYVHNRAEPQVARNIETDHHAFVVRNNTSLNIGRTGGREWTRSAAKPAPMMPQAMAQKLGVRPRVEQRDVRQTPERAPERRTEGNPMPTYPNMPRLFAPQGRQAPAPRSTPTWHERQVQPRPQEHLSPPSAPQRIEPAPAHQDGARIEQRGSDRAAHNAPPHEDRSQDNSHGRDVHKDK